MPYVEVTYPVLLLLFSAMPSVSVVKTKRATEFCESLNTVCLQFFYVWLACPWKSSSTYNHSYEVGQEIWDIQGNNYTSKSDNSILESFMAYFIGGYFSRIKLAPFESQVLPLLCGNFFKSSIRSELFMLHILHPFIKVTLNTPCGQSKERPSYGNFTPYMYYPVGWILFPNRQYLLFLRFLFTVWELYVI